MVEIFGYLALFSWLTKTSFCHHQLSLYFASFRELHANDLLSSCRAIISQFVSLYRFDFDFQFAVARVLFSLRASSRFCLLLWSLFGPSNLIWLLDLNVAVLVLRTCVVPKNKAPLIFLPILCVVCFVNPFEWISMDKRISARSAAIMMVFWKLILPASHPDSLVYQGALAGTNPECLSECTLALCPSLLPAFWIPFFVLETSTKLVLSH